MKPIVGSTTHDSFLHRVGTKKICCSDHTDMTDAYLGLLPGGGGGMASIIETSGDFALPTALAGRSAT